MERRGFESPNTKFYQIEYSILNNSLFIQKKSERIYWFGLVNKVHTGEGSTNKKCVLLFHLILYMKTMLQLKNLYLYDKN